MLDILKAAEAALPALLATDGWRSLDINYHPPRVERLYRAWGEYRISLHRVHPCAMDQALFHPHPWPSAMRILAGRYRMIVGHGAGVTEPPVTTTLELPAGAAYEMVHPDAWHAVVPVGEPSLSVMVTGRPWDRPTPVEPAVTLYPLPPAAVGDLLDVFRRHYPAATDR